MANANKPFGFRPVKHLNGSPYNGQANIYQMPAADSVSGIAVGDMVVLSDQAATLGYMAIERPATGDVASAALVGAVVGFVVDPAALNSPQVRLDDTLRYALVADSPDLIFEVQEDATTDANAIAAASVGLMTGFAATAPNVTTTGLSNMELDSSAVNTTSTLPLQIMGIVDSPDNTIATAHARWLVRINTHAFGWAGLAGV